MPSSSALLAKRAANPKNMPAKMLKSRISGLKEPEKAMSTREERKTARNIPKNFLPGESSPWAKRSRMLW